MRRRGAVSSPLLLPRLLRLLSLHVIGQRRRSRLHVAVGERWTQRGLRLVKPDRAVVRVIGLILLEQLLVVAAARRRILLIVERRAIRLSLRRCCLLLPSAD